MSETILAWLNSDDYYVPGTFEAIAEAAVAHPDSGALVGGMSGGDFVQPSCFFRDTAWHAVGPLDEAIHIAFDVDLWMRMVKAGYTFLPIDRLLSQVLSYPTAKTTAYTNLMRVDRAIVAIRHGGEHVVRKHLEDMAIRLSWSEPNLTKILDNPVVKLLAPLVGLFVQPAARRRDAVPPWLKR